MSKLTTKKPSKELPPAVESVMHRGTGSPLDAETRAYMEERFGEDFSGVRIHLGPEAHESAKEVAATAYTVGHDVVFAEGKYAPDTSDGQKLLSHELAHVIQQERGGGSAPSLDSGHPLEGAARQAAAAFDGTNGTVDVSGSSATGLARQEDPTTDLIRRVNDAERDRHKPKQDLRDLSRFAGAPLSPTHVADFLESTKVQQTAASQRLTLPDGTIISLASPPPKEVIPPPKPGERTKDVTFGKTVLLPANVEGQRANIIRKLNIELKRIEDNTSICRGAAEEFLTQWPIVRRLADLVGGANPPRLSIWNAVDDLVAKSRDAIARNDLEEASEIQVHAAKSLRWAQSTWAEYKDRNIGGAETIQHGAEHTRDAAKYTLFALAVVASGGTAAIVATAGTVAIDVADAAAKAALGDKVDWGQVGIDVAVQIITLKCAGPLSGKLAGALVKRGIAGPLASKIVQNVVGGLEVRSLHAGLTKIYQTAFSRNPPMTWAQVWDELTDPQSIFIDLLIGTYHGRVSSPTPRADRGSAPASTAAKQPESVQPVTPKEPSATGKNVNESSAHDTESVAHKNQGGSPQPDIRSQFQFERWEAAGKTYKRAAGRLGQPNEVQTHRDLKAQRTQSSGTGDDAGHLIGDRFGPPGGAENLSPQNWKSNRSGSFKDLENVWAAKRKNNVEIDVEVTDVSRAGEDRPFMRRVKWTETAPGGSKTTPPVVDFANPHTPESREKRNIAPTVHGEQENNLIELDFVNKKRKP